MLENLLFGSLTTAACVVIQCVVVSVLLRVLLVLERKGFVRHTLAGTSWLLAVVMLIMLAGTLIQITVWAGLFMAYGEFKEFGTAFYHSVVNFSTLGYGDLVMSDERRLLGALEAANGVLMFGLATGVMFAVLSDLMNRAWDSRVGAGSDSGRAVHLHERNPS
jgi:hypothetical protein